jgi:light-dependent protochlorophyllide reductase
LGQRDVVLVTGGNSGIGLGCARELARQGRQVLIASRDRAASAEAVRRIEQECGAGSAFELGLDLGSLESVRQLVEQIEARDLPLRALVCNAGLQFQHGPKLSPEGYELTFAVNHLGHFLLVNLLIARLAARAPARIVVVASGVHDPKLRTGMPKANVGDLDVLAATGGPEPGRFDGRLAYVNSKLCNLWFTYELARRISAAGLTSEARPLTVNGYDPGLVAGSGLARDYSPVLRWVWERVLPRIGGLLSRFVVVSTAAKSGAALARLVTDPSLERVTGRYYPSHTAWQEAASSDASYDESRARSLWQASVRMSGLAPGESPLLGS